MRESSEGPEPAGEALGFEAYRALYDHSPDGVLFTVPDGRVLAANPAACELLGRNEAEICALGRQRLTDQNDTRWNELLAERERTGRVRGVARMFRGDGSLIEVEVSARIFSTVDGERRACTILRDVTDRVQMERELAAMSARLRELTFVDELTGLRNRRGFVSVASQILIVADRQQAPVVLMFLDVDNMKELNDDHGHAAGDAALQSVARALQEVLRNADTLSRIGGDEFVALAVGPLDGAARMAIEQRIHSYLTRPEILTAVGRRIEVSLGWASRIPGEEKTVEALLDHADRAMYRGKARKDGERRRPSQA